MQVQSCRRTIGSRFVLRTGLLLCVLASVSGSAVFAEDNQLLQQRVEALEIELAQLRGVSTFQTQPDQLILPVPNAVPENLQPVAAKPAEPFKPTINLGGFFQADWGLFSQDANNIATVGDIQDGADFRRARLNAHGDVWTNVGYMIEFDFAFPGRPSFMDVFLDLKDTAFGTIRVGQWRQPIGMDGLTSVKELTFLERSLPFAFLPFRQIGAGFFDRSNDESTAWAVSVFRYPTDVYGSNVGDNGGYGMASRLTHVWAYPGDDSHLLHLGTGFSFADPANDRIRYRYQPEFFVSETGAADLVPVGVPSTVPPFVDTGPIAANNYKLFNAEAAATFGSLYMQSEAYVASVDQIALGNANFTGAYAYAGYFLTGEVRPYNRAAGTYGRVMPHCNVGRCGGCGAWEVAGRLSHIDLDDANIMGGRLTDSTFGLNWYLNPNTKFQFNWIHAFLDAPVFGDSDADIFAFRGQIDF